MSLIKVKKLVNGRGLSYAPATEEAVINTDQVVSIVPVTTMRTEACVEIWFSHGVPAIQCVGKPSDFLEDKYG